MDCGSIPYPINKRKKTGGFMVTVSRASDRLVLNRGKFVIRRNYPGLKRNNPDERGLATLGAFDHSTLEPGFTIGMHPHANDEILSYMRRGTMYHSDSKGIHMPINAHKMMMMNAGEVIYHEEDVPQDAAPIDMLQVFFRPHTDDLEPTVQFAEFDEEFSDDEWRWIGGPDHSAAPLKIRSESWLYDTRLRDSSSIQTPELKGRTGYLYVFSGAVQLPGHDVTLEKGDGALVENEDIEVKAHPEAEIVYFMVDESAPYSRSGMYSG